MQRMIMMLGVMILALTAWILAVPESSATQNCIAWEQSMRNSAGADDHEGVGPPAIDRLTGDEPYGELLGDWAADNCMRLNHDRPAGRGEHGVHAPSPR
jgi:hypothetical protein